MSPTAVERYHHDSFHGVIVPLCNALEFNFLNKEMKPFTEMKVVDRLKLHNTADMLTLVN